MMISPPWTYTATTVAMIVVMTFNAAVIAEWLRRRRWWRVAVAIFFVLVGMTTENSPKEVPYHEGMTLCPGQTAVGVIPIPLPPLATPEPQRHL